MLKCRNSLCFGRRERSGAILLRKEAEADRVWGVCVWLFEALCFSALGLEVLGLGLGEQAVLGCFRLTCDEFS